MKNFLAIFAFGIMLTVSGAFAQLAPPDNYGQSLNWLERAAERGDPEAQYILARKLEIGLETKADIEVAAKWYEKAAAGGQVQAQFRIGELYYSGVGVSKNLKEAARWFESAVNQGFMPAAYNLGLMYERGLGVEKNFARASALYQRAADVGITEAQINLALLFFQGKGVIKDNGRALMWLEIAKRSGGNVSQSILDFLVKKMSPGEVESTTQKAINRLEKIKQTSPK